MLRLRNSRFLCTPATGSDVLQDILACHVEGAHGPETQIWNQKQSVEKLAGHDSAQPFAVMRHPVSWYPEFYKSQSALGWPAAAFDRTVALTCDGNRGFSGFMKWVQRVLAIEHGFQSRYFRQWFGRNLNHTSPVLYELLPVSLVGTLDLLGEKSDTLSLVEQINGVWTGYASAEKFWLANWKLDQHSWSDFGLVRRVIEAEAPIVAGFYPQFEYSKSVEGLF